MASVRRIRPGDGERLRQVRLAALSDSPFAFSSTYGQESSISEAEWADRARGGSDGTERTTLIASDGNDVIGIIGGYRSQSDGPVIELVSMWIAPSARGKGIARELVEALLDWAKTAHVRAVELWVTERASSPALKLYESAGFVPTGERAPLRTGSHEWVARMSKSLP